MWLKAIGVKGGDMKPKFLRSAFAGPTVQTVSAFYDHRSTGFDYLRLGLALAVAIWHSFLICYDRVALDSPFVVVVLLILPMFFALSGYLVSGSLLRVASIHEFLTLRVIRIVPALAVEVLLSAVIVGGVFTTLPLLDYYTHPMFFAYFRNIIGDIHFLLPGVFTDLARPRVNGSLWTIPYELECYIAIALLWVIGATRHRIALVLLVAVIFAVVALGVVVHDNPVRVDGALPGRMLVVSFLCGMLIYFYRDRIVLRRWMFVAAVVVALAVLSSGYTAWLVALPAAYIVAFLGLTNPPKIPVIMDGDYSYGIYLYAVPIQKSVFVLFPAYREWWFNLPVSAVFFCIFAAFSWHCVEKPIHQRRRRIVGAVDRAVAALTGRWRLFGRRRPAADANAGKSAGYGDPSSPARPRG